MSRGSLVRTGEADGNGAVKLAARRQASHKCGGEETNNIVEIAESERGKNGEAQELSQDGKMKRGRAKKKMQVF